MAEQGAMWRMAGAAGDPLKTVHRVFEGGIPGLPIRLNLKILSWISAKSASLLSNDVAADPRFDHGKDGPPKGLTSILAVPLFQARADHRVLAVVNSRRPGGFTESDRRLLGIIGIQCAQLLEKARQERGEAAPRAGEGPGGGAADPALAPPRRAPRHAGLRVRRLVRARAAGRRRPLLRHELGNEVHLAVADYRQGDARLSLHGQPAGQHPRPGRRGGRTPRS